MKSLKLHLFGSADIMQDPGRKRTSEKNSMHAWIKIVNVAVIILLNHITLWNVIFILIFFMILKTWRLFNIWHIFRDSGNILLQKEEYQKGFYAACQKYYPTALIVLSDKTDYTLSTEWQNWVHAEHWVTNWVHTEYWVTKLSTRWVLSDKTENTLSTQW